MDLPHLVLYRNGTLTDADERTLVVEVSDIEVPPAGVTATLQVETQHGDPDLGSNHGLRIPVWRQSHWIANTSGSTHTGATAVFTLGFSDMVISGTETVLMPTDYFWYDVAVIDARHPVTNPLLGCSGDHALLMENQWIAPLPTVQEASDGAAPDELAVYTCDMVPFRKSSNDSTTWLLRKDVPDYVHTELVPQMIEAFRVQTGVWGFPWTDAWTGYRVGVDTERLSVALTDGRTWYHGRAPFRGHAGIAIRIEGGENAWYDTLTDGIMSTFHHELFHSLQRNINLNYGGDGDVDGGQKTWQLFSEGTAVLASSVGQPAVEFMQTSGPGAYMSNANSFLGDGGHMGDLSRSYERMSAYHGAIYWRFLYEQCGGKSSGVENPSAGMDVIRRALMTLYAGEVVDIGSSIDLVKHLPQITDRALQGSACPFQTYEESLIAFGRAIYALRLDSGRCTAPGTSVGCGFYDPNNLYYDPPFSTITYAGGMTTYAKADQPFPGGIRSSYGMNFVDVILDPAADGQTLKIEFYGAPGADAEFVVQLWKLTDSGQGARPQRVPTQTTAPEVMRANEDGRLIYVFPAIDTTAYNRLGLIITRVDANESSDPVGEYTIVLSAGAGSE